MSDPDRKGCDALNGRCPFSKLDPAIIKEMQHSIKGLTQTMNDHEQLLESIQQVPKKVDELRDSMRQTIADLRDSMERTGTELRKALEKLGGGLIKAFVFIGMSVLAVVIVLGLIVVSWGRISVDAGTVKIQPHIRTTRPLPLEAPKP